LVSTTKGQSRNPEFLPERTDSVADLTLTPDEATIIANALQSYVSDLRMEIADTDAQPVRERLKKEEAVLKAVIQRLAGPSVQR
jgi:ethanolamine utilization microcompartment shell protein EutS